MLTSTLEQQGYAFGPAYGALNQNQLLGAQQNQVGDIDIPFTATVYLFLSKHPMLAFYFDRAFTTYVFSSSSNKPTERALKGTRCDTGIVRRTRTTYPKTTK